jgi:hypothetical protein
LKEKTFVSIEKGVGNNGVQVASLNIGTNLTVPTVLGVGVVLSFTIEFILKLSLNIVGGCFPLAVDIARK